MKPNVKFSPTPAWIERERAEARPYKSDKELVDECVEIHLALSDSAFEQARGRATGLDGLTQEKAVQQARLAWSAMQRARLFCFTPDRWVQLYETSDRYTTIQLAGLEWRPNRRAVHRVADELQLDSGVMWNMGVEEAFAAGYIDRNDDGTSAVSEKGRQVFFDRLKNMTPERRVGVAEMLKVAEEARRRGDKKTLAMACAQIEDVLYEEDPADAEKIMSVYEDYGVRWPFPDPLPFDSCFFCFGRRLDLVYSPTALHTRVRPNELEELGVRSVYLLGYLVAWEGDVPFIFTAMQFGDGDGLGGVDEHKVSAVGLLKTYEDSEWTQPMSLDPWIVTMLVEAVNNHKQIIKDHPATLTTRMARKRASKRHKQLLPLPAPFYMVNLKDEFIATPVKPKKMTSGRPVEWSHRWDVRGHECVRIERGELPMNPKEIEKLRKRNYRIYEGMSLSAEDAARLLKRGIRAPGPKEWIAVLAYWRDAFMKGPEDRPYIPAARHESA